MEHNCCVVPSAFADPQDLAWKTWKIWAETMVQELGKMVGMCWEYAGNMLGILMFSGLVMFSVVIYRLIDIDSDFTKMSET